MLVIGGGIVGLATARAVLVRRPGARVLVVDKEPVVASHQTGRNSGVVHSGVYYRPGSLKARLTATGRAELLAWCAERGVPVVERGKLIVATEPDELAPLAELERRAEANGVAARRVDGAGIVEVEPHATGLAALHVPGVQVVDYGAVARALADEVVEHGGEIRLRTAVDEVHDDGNGVVATTSGGDVRAAVAVACAGLQSDLVARRSSGVDPTSGARRTTTASDPAGSLGRARIVPFRGEYHELRPERAHLCRGLIYPVPDPRYPFLGVHLTRGLDGGVHVGPNAVLALAREGYRWRDVDARLLAELASWSGTWALARRYWRTGAAEVARSLSHRLLVRAVQRLVPAVEPDDLVRAD
ncbi:MAG TPA: L-2-hydroxyglutarate oxidase, partial [Acidimicrobiales bacterium]|nr:L-2-hydroxyglutarate oxidase [Acidimicrobiales bacterium]